MALIDDVHITVKAGDGGNGGTAKKQLFGSKKTAPDGGNGGNGGSVYFKGTSNLSDLSDFQFRKNIKGNNGVNGLNKDLDGANGEDIEVLVPFGTTVTDETTGEWVEILTDQPFAVAHGGQGGMGNHDYNPELNKFKGRKFEGELGDDRKLHLVLNLIADIGLVGLPNAGKSSLLKTLTNATPKIGAYPFTTLEPNLGVYDGIVLADIPGLIEGASDGRGLGIQFLKHIQKTKILLHCIDSSSDDVMDIYKTVRQEFEAYDKSLTEKEEIILLTKKDLVDKHILAEKIKELESLKKKIITVSIYDEKSLEDLKKVVADLNLKR